MNLDFTQVNVEFILQGVWVTLQFTLLAAFFGFLWGAVLSLFKISNIKVLEWFGVVYTSIFRGTPLIVTISLIYFGTPQITGYLITPLEAGVLTLALNSAAYVSETIRAGILAVDKGQREAAMALGVPYRRTMLDIIFPQAFKNILPAMVNESIALLKDSALVSTIGALDILRRAAIQTAEKFIYFEPYLIAALIYYVMVMALTLGARILERRLRRSD